MECGTVSAKTAPGVTGNSDMVIGKTTNDNLILEDRIVKREGGR